MTLSSWFLEEENIHRPLINRNHAEHVCVDWDSVLRWLEDRNIPPSERVRTKYGHISQEEMMLRAKAH